MYYRSFTGDHAMQDTENALDNADIFPAGLNAEQKKAIRWKIDSDYQKLSGDANVSATHYAEFAVKFYTRTDYSLEEVVMKFRAHKLAEWKRSRAQAFFQDMASKAGAETAVYH